MLCVNYIKHCILATSNNPWFMGICSVKINAYTDDWIWLLFCTLYSQLNMNLATRINNVRAELTIFATPPMASTVSISTLCTWIIVDIHVIYEVQHGLIYIKWSIISHLNILDRLQIQGKNRINTFQQFVVNMYGWSYFGLRIIVMAVS